MAKKPSKSPQPIPISEIIEGQQRLKANQNQERMSLEEFKKILQDDSKKLDTINDTLEEGLLSTKPGTLGNSINKLLEEVKGQGIGINNGGKSGGSRNTGVTNHEDRRQQAPTIGNDANRVITQMAQEGAKPYRNMFERGGQRLFDIKMGVSDLFGKNNKAAATANKIINTMSGGLLRRKETAKDIFLEEQIAAGTTKSDKEIRKDFNIHRKALIALDRNTRQIESLRRRTRMSNEDFEAGPGAQLLAKQKELTQTISQVDIRAAKSGFTATNDSLSGNIRNKSSATLSNNSAVNNMITQNNMEATLENYKEIEKQTGLLQKIEENTRCCCDKKKKEENNNSFSLPGIDIPDIPEIDLPEREGKGKNRKGKAGRRPNRGGRFGRLGKAGRIFGRLFGGLAAGGLSLYENKEELWNTGAVDPLGQLETAASGLGKIFNTKDDLFSMNRLEGIGDVLSGATSAVLGAGTQVGKALYDKAGIGTGFNKILDWYFGNSDAKVTAPTSSKFIPPVDTYSSGDTAPEFSSPIVVPPSGTENPKYKNELNIPPEGTLLPLNEPSTRVDVATDKKTLVDAAASTIEYQDKAKQDQKESLSTLGSIKDILGKVLLGILGISEAKAGELPSGQGSTSANFDNQNVSFPNGIDTTAPSFSSNTSPLGPKPDNKEQFLGWAVAGLQKEFINRGYSPEQAAVFSKGAAAQLQLEVGSNFGKTVGTNNFFNVKEHSGKFKGDLPGIRAFDKSEKSKDVYASYSTPELGFKSYVDFLHKNPRYTTAGVFKATNTSEYADALQRGKFATDPLYANKIKSILNSRKFNQRLAAYSGENTSSINVLAADSISGNNNLMTINDYAKELGAARVGSGFGPRTPPKKGASSNHKGIDLPGKLGTPIRMPSTMKAGTVIQAGPSGGAGNKVTIRHDDGTTTEYMHLSAIGVQQGQKVDKTAVLGRMGSTGISTGSHLHFGMKNAAGQYVNPAKALKESNATILSPTAASMSPTGAISPPQSINPTTAATMSPTTGSMNVNAGAVTIQSSANAEATLKAQSGGASGTPVVINNNVDNSSTTKNIANVSKPARDSDTPFDKWGIRI